MIKRKNRKFRILLVGSLGLLTFPLIQSQGSIKPAFFQCRIIADTIPCKLVPINEPDFKAVLDIRATVSNGLYDFVNTDTNSTSITYIQYVRSSGHYIAVKIITDSSGNYLTNEFKYNYDVKNFNKRYKKEIENLKALDYPYLLENKDFITSNCYISDGAELFVFAQIRGKIINGIVMVDGLEKYKLNKSLEQFIDTNKKIFRKR